MNEKLIYGKSSLQNITSVEFEDGLATMFLNNGGFIQQEQAHYALYSQNVDNECIPLSGNSYYKYVKKYNTMDDLRKDYGKYSYQKKVDGYVLWNPKEQFMVRSGVTYFKGLKPKDVSVLSFDLETTSLKPSDNDKVLLISNTFRDASGVIEKRLFAYDDYKSTKEMIYAWCSYVNEKNPSIICGHNILGFDLPYLKYYVRDLSIGRNNRPCEFANKTSEFRKEGSQTYTYTNCLAFGREIVDTMFLSYKYDAATRKYESYGLKSIIRTEGLERQDRQFYDAGQIRFNYKDAVEWEKIKTYAIDDADDSLALFDLMIPSYFYFTQAVPKSLQQVVNGASGSQVNSWMVRAYLQDGASIPKASDVVDFEGAISFGNPGIYQNVSKVDVASLYPSIIIQENIYDRTKDPRGYFLEMVKYFTRHRLENKRLGIETGNRFYKDLEQSQKIFINSAYGFMGATGCNFNSPKLAAQITCKGREILHKGMDWAKSRGLLVINGDTDSFCFTGSRDFKEEIRDLNSKFPDQIKWTDDGQFKSMVIIKAKNYAMLTNKGIKIKGSGLKATMKEAALRKFMNDCLAAMLENRIDEIVDLYSDCVNQISNVNGQTIKDWVSKKTVTKAILNPKRTNESRPADAIKGRGLVEGDKFYVYFRTPIEIRCIEDFDGVYDKNTLYKKLYATIKIFDGIIDLSKFPNHSLKRNRPTVYKDCRSDQPYVERN